jgi:dihydrolipoamide dehydrogenase
VTIVGSKPVLLASEDREVAEAFTAIASDRHDVHVGFRAVGVSATESGVEVAAESSDGERISVGGDSLLVATGRRPNADTLDVSAAGITTDDRGFVATNEFLETSAENVWAQGDIAGNFLFKHSGDYETRHMVDNVVHGERRPIEYAAMPHAVFTEPQIAGVGATEAELRDDGVAYVVGRAEYADSAMGRAKKLEDGFVKVLATPDGEILGCHVMGYEASTLVHEAVVAMRTGATVEDVAETIHAHPTLSRVVEAAFRNVPQ